MNAKTLRQCIPGPAGQIEIAIDLPTINEEPECQAMGFGVIAHPHPLYGGNLDNKVVQTLCRAFLERGMVSVRPHFRGVGQSEGVHDHGQGEVFDLFAVWAWAEHQLEATLNRAMGQKRWAAGFSFGASMTTHVLAQWADQFAQSPLKARAPSRAVLVGLPTERFHPAPLDARCRLIHGEKDEVCGLEGALRHAQAAGLWVATLPGAGHFFHGQLQTLRAMTAEALADA
ncbi:MAG: hypothetical protein RL133_1890 [Pseudomonadota bacterium]